MKNGSPNNFMNRGLVFSIFSIIIILLLINNVLSVTANIGNARMILRANVGDTIQKTILVKNVNNETIRINITASGDLEKDIKVLDNNFTLAPDEEKNARFTIKVTKTGGFENRINVFFYSLSEQKGVALSSNVIVMVNTDGAEDNSSAEDSSNTNDNSNVEDNSNVDNSESKPINPIMILLAITGIILIIFFVVLIMYYIKNKQEVKENKESKEEDIEKEKSEEKSIEKEDVDETSSFKKDFGENKKGKDERREKKKTKPQKRSTRNV